MVGLSDIPCVGVALNKISEATVEAAYRGLRYMFCYKSLVNDLNSEIETFNIQKSRVSQKFVEARDNGKILEDHVTKWQKNGVEIHKSFKDFTERYKKRASWRCIQCVPIPNPLSRFRLGREAVQKTEKVAALTESGKELLANPIARLPPVENRPKTDGEFQNFPSRQHAYEKIWQSLVTEGSPSILGIYGMPGSGKTRMTEQIWEEVKQKGIFDKVTRAVVSNEKLEVKKLQNDLAGHLNCSFESQDDVDRRASQLKQSLMNGGKILVILDDVWRKIPLDVIGIHFGADSSSKIILTSREENVCLSNDCIDPVKITALTVDEAWDLFKDSVGTNKIESLQDESLAKQVCLKCAGLPLIICAVGKTLKFMSQHLWEDALKQLENCNIQSVPGIGPEVYACLKLSINNLDKDAKLCLLLSSIYPEDTDINIRNLIMIANGSQLVDGSRVFAMVDILKSSSLLLEDRYDNAVFKLHDIIRDVARSIAVNDYAFHFARSDMQLLHNYNLTPKLLCLDINDISFYSPEDMVCDGIYTLRIESTFIRKFQVWEVASMCVNLRFLNLKNIEWEQQIHVQQLGKLRTLVLEECNICKTDFSFISENLETLSLWDCDLPEPLNIINLKHLRKLEIIGEPEPVFLVANTISCLSSLEELHLPNGYRYQRYGEEVDDDEFTHIQLNDISKLTRLKSLKMHFAGASLQHVQHPNLFSNLREFDIYVGIDGRQSTYGFFAKKSIQMCDSQSEEVFRRLIESAQQVILLSTNIDVSSIFNSNTEAFADLQFLRIDGSKTMKQLARILSQNQQIQPQTSFYKLTQLYITNCSAMKYLFSNSVAKCLVQLVRLSVQDCDVMETIIMNDDSTIDGQDIIINFSKLKSLRLQSLPRLKSFYLENKDIHSSSLFCGKVAFPALEELYVRYLEDEISDIWGKHYYNDNASSFSNLKRLQVFACTKLETVIPLSMSHKLQNLEILAITDCRSVISEVSTYDNNTTVCPLVALTQMSLEYLPCLTNTWLNSMDHSHATNLYPNLTELHIKGCHSLSVDHSQATNLYPHLKELYIEESDSSSV